MAYPEPQVEIMQLDLSTILSQAQRPKKQKKAKIKSIIYKDESGSRIAEIVIPLEKVAREQLRAKDYAISTVDLGPATRTERVDEFKGSVTSILE